MLCALTLYASDEGVSLEIRQAGADGVVVDSGALGVHAAHAGARIDALVAHARPVGGAVCVHLTFEATAGVRVAKVAGLAGADAAVVAGATGVGVRAARVRVARVHRLGLGTGEA